MGKISGIRRELDALSVCVISEQVAVRGLVVLGVMLGELIGAKHPTRARGVEVLDPELSLVDHRSEGVANRDEVKGFFQNRLLKGLSGLGSSKSAAVKTRPVPY